MADFAFSIAALDSADACDFEVRVVDLAAALGRTPAYYEPIPLAVWWSLPSTSTEDRIWSLRLLGPESLPAIRAFAQGCADRARGYAGRSAANTDLARMYADRAARVAFISRSALAPEAAAIHAANAAGAADGTARAVAFEGECAAQRADLDRLFFVEIPTTPRAVPLSDCLEDRCDPTA